MVFDEIETQEREAIGTTSSVHKNKLAKQRERPTGTQSTHGPRLLKEGAVQYPLRFKATTALHGALHTTRTNETSGRIDVHLLS